MRDDYLLCTILPSARVIPPPRAQHADAPATTRVGSPGALPPAHPGVPLTTCDQGQEHGLAREAREPKENPWWDGSW